MKSARIVMLLGLIATGTGLIWINVPVQAAHLPPVGKQFTIAVYETAEEFALRTDSSAKGGEYWKGWGTYHKAMESAGILKGGMPLLPSETVRQVRVRDGKTEIKEGAFAPSNPQLSGFFLIEVDSLEKAIEWAAKAPNASTSVVEVRPAFPVAMPINPK